MPGHIKPRYCNCFSVVMRQTRRIPACTVADKNNNNIKMTTFLRQKWFNFWSMIDQQLQEKFPVLASRLRYVEGVTGIRKDHVLLAFAFLVMLYIITTGYFATLSSDLLSFAYPLYCSIKAKESMQKEKIENWLLYWIVYSSLLVIEYFAGYLLNLLSFYYLLRTAFLIWCMSPCPENGSHFVYKRLIQPFFMHHHGQVETAFTVAKTEMQNVIAGSEGETIAERLGMTERLRTTEVSPEKWKHDL